MDGEWEAPLVDNPVCEKAVGCGKWKAPLIANKEYKGKWRAPMIDNPNYRGKWTPRQIPNPDFFEDLTPFKMTPIVSEEKTHFLFNKIQIRNVFSIFSRPLVLNYGPCLVIFYSIISL